MYQGELYMSRAVKRANSATKSCPLSHDLRLLGWNREASSALLSVDSLSSYDASLQSWELIANGAFDAPKEILRALLSAFFGCKRRLGWVVHDSLDEVCCTHEAVSACGLRPTHGFPLTLAGLPGSHSIEQQHVIPGKCQFEQLPGREEVGAKPQTVATLGFTGYRFRASGAEFRLHQGGSRQHNTLKVTCMK